MIYYVFGTNIVIILKKANTENIIPIVISEYISIFVLLSSLIVYSLYVHKGLNITSNNVSTDSLIFLGSAT